MQDEFGDRMKHYEGLAESQLIPYLPICVRIDGRGFSKFTRGFNKPFDPDITEAMFNTTSYLVEQTHARIGYTQSDEISLVLLNEERNAEMLFGGRVQKLASVLAGMTSTRFALELSKTHPERVASRVPHFDARVWQVPSKDEAANVLLWRAQDARRNAITGACRAHHSPKQMYGKNQAEMLAMLSESGIDFSREYPDYHRYGAFFKRAKVPTILSPEELARIPPKHRPTGMVIRSRVYRLEAPFFGEVEDRVNFVFGECPM